MADKTPSPVDKSGKPAPQFTEREQQMLGWAMMSLKGGAAPDVDFDKLAAHAGMTNSGSARNAWTKIKNKIFTGADGAVAPTPKKGGAKKKDAGDAPPKTPASRKRGAKKADADAEESPTKKPRGKKSQATVKAEDDEDAADADDTEVKGEAEDED